MRTTGTLLAVVCLLGIVSAGCGDDSNDGRDSSTRTVSIPDATKAPGATAPKSLRLVAVGQFDEPLLVTFAPGRPGIVVVEKTGRALLVNGDQRTTLLDVRGEVSLGGEQGLLGVAFHPQFGDNGRMFVDLTDPEGDTRILEYKLAAEGAARKVRELLKIDQPYSNHNGGHLAFGPDGHLWIASGDGGSGGDPHGNGQSTDTLLGKLLRIDVDADAGERGYAIPDGNPFKEDGGRGEIWATGLRNPWRFSFDRETDLLFIGDVGQGEREEIDLVDPGAMPRGGYNFGWSRFEGTRRHSDQPIGPGAYARPVYEFDHEDGSCSVTGGHVYRGSKQPALQGWYVFADFCNDWIRLAPAPGAADEISRIRPDDVVEFPATQGISSFGEDESGELYATSLEGAVSRIEAE